MEKEDTLVEREEKEDTRVEQARTKDTRVEREDTKEKERQKERERAKDMAHQGQERMEDALDVPDLHAEANIREQCCTKPPIVMHTGKHRILQT
jgi:hypothetical protein